MEYKPNLNVGSGSIAVFRQGRVADLPEASRKEIERLVREKWLVDGVPYMVMGTLPYTGSRAARFDPKIQEGDLRIYLGEGLADTMLGLVNLKWVNAPAGLFDVTRG